MLVEPGSALVLFLGAAALLWWGAGALGRRMVSDGQPDSEGGKIVAEAAQAIAFSVVGLFILVRAIPPLASTCTWLALRREEFVLRYDTQTVSTFVSLGLQIALGVGLLFGARGLAGFVKTIRTAGHVKARATSEESAPTDSQPE